MQGEQKERWKYLCEQVAEEHDPQQFSELVAELLDELRKKDQRLMNLKGTPAKAN